MSQLTLRPRILFTCPGFGLGFFVVGGSFLLLLLGIGLHSYRETGKARAYLGLGIECIRGECSPGLHPVRNICISLITSFIAKCYVVPFCHVRYPLHCIALLIPSRPAHLHSPTSSCLSNPIQHHISLPATPLCTFTGDLFQILTTEYFLDGQVRDWRMR